MVPRLRECWRQNQAEVVSKSSNTIVKSYPSFQSFGPARFSLVFLAGNIGIGSWRSIIFFRRHNSTPFEVASAMFTTLIAPPPLPLYSLLLLFRLCLLDWAPSRYGNIRTRIRSEIGLGSAERWFLLFAAPARNLKQEAAAAWKDEIVFFWYRACTRFGRVWVSFFNLSGAETIERLARIQAFWRSDARAPIFV